ncbi:hypothetical protein LDENG_00288940, partial [Lucifuga dentata]
MSGVSFVDWTCEMIFSALRMPNSVLRELRLIDTTFSTKDIDILSDGLKHPKYKLEALSLLGNGRMSKNLASAVKSIISNLRELELSSKTLDNWLMDLLPLGLSCPKLEIL